MPTKRKKPTRATKSIGTKAGAPELRGVSSSDTQNQADMAFEAQYENQYKDQYEPQYESQPFDFQEYSSAPMAEEKAAPTRRRTSVQSTSNRVSSRPLSSDGRISSQSNSVDERKASTPRKSAAKVQKKHHVLAIVFAVVLVALLAFGALLTWDRYYRYDDALDIQGLWHTEAGVAVFIDEAYINMPQDISYEYTINTQEKTISYTFAGLTGGGSYEFAPERDVLTITEGAGEKAVSVTLIRDQKKTDAPDDNADVHADDESDAQTEDHTSNDNANKSKDSSVTSDSTKEDSSASPIENSDAQQPENDTEDHPAQDIGANAVPLPDALAHAGA